MFNGERSTASTTGPIDKGPTPYQKSLSSYKSNIQNFDFKNQAPTSMVYYLNITNRGLTTKDGVS